MAQEREGVGKELRRAGTHTKAPPNPAETNPAKTRQNRTQDKDRASSLKQKPTQAQQNTNPTSQKTGPKNKEGTAPWLKLDKGTKEDGVPTRELI